jgi:hypothetical protein
MVPGFTERECQVAEMRRQELLATVARERRFVQTQPGRPRDRMGGMRRHAATPVHTLALLVASFTRLPA